MHHSRATIARVGATLVVLGASGLFFKTYAGGAFREIGRADSTEWAVIIGCAVAGVGARGCIARAWSRKSYALSALTVLAVVTLFVKELGIDENDYPPEGLPHLVGQVLFKAAPLLLMMRLVGSKRRRPQFAMGAAGGCLLFWWDTPLLLLIPLFGFAIARDVGAVETCTPTRQRFAQYGVGALAAVFVLALGFDLAATTTYDTTPFLPWGQYGQQAGYLGDAPLPRWLRMFTEAGVIVSCFAHSRGRTWGVLGLLALLPAVAVQVITSGSDLPHWTFGCMSASHPLRLNPFLIPAALVAVTPWLAPLVRGLLPERVRSD